MRPGKRRVKPKPGSFVDRLPAHLVNPNIAGGSITVDEYRRELAEALGIPDEEAAEVAELTPVPWCIRLRDWLEQP